MNNTVLDPMKTKIVVDAILWDTEYLLDSNNDEVYTFTFAPATMFDHQRLFEHIETSKAQIEIMSDPYTEKEPRFNGEIPGGFVRCSQMYKPKVSLRADHWSELAHQTVTLNLNLNDDPTGRVYLNCAYVDPYINPCEDDEADTLLTSDDVDDLF